MANDLGYGDAGCYGVPDFTTPRTGPYIEFEVTAAHSPSWRFVAAIGELDVLMNGKGKSE